MKITRVVKTELLKLLDQHNKYDTGVFGFYSDFDIKLPKGQKAKGLLYLDPSRNLEIQLLIIDPNCALSEESLWDLAKYITQGPIYENLIPDTDVISWEFQWGFCFHGIPEELKILHNHYKEYLDNPSLKDTFDFDTMLFLRLHISDYAS
jgi:hypothetical protein